MFCKVLFCVMITDFGSQKLRTRMLCAYARVCKLGWSEKHKSWKMQQVKADSEPCHSTDFRTIFGIMIEVCRHWEIIIRTLHFICYTQNVLRSLLGEPSSKVYCWSSAVTVIRGVSLSSSSSYVLAFKISVQCSNSFYKALAIQHNMLCAFSATRFYMQLGLAG